MLLNARRFASRQTEKEVRHARCFDSRSMTNERKMALFGNESNKINNSENQTTPQPPTTLSSAPYQTRAPGPSAGTPAYLDRETRVSGKLHFEGPAKIDGQVEGEIKGKEITIGEHAVLSAQIFAESIVVCGTIDGDITAIGRIEIRTTGKVVGNISTPALVIQEGGHFEGQCAMAKEPEGRKATAHHNGAHTPTRAEEVSPAKTC